VTKEKPTYTEKGGETHLTSVEKGKDGSVCGKGGTVTKKGSYTRTEGAWYWWGGRLKKERVFMGATSKKKLMELPPAGKVDGKEAEKKKKFPGDLWGGGDSSRENKGNLEGGGRQSRVTCHSSSKTKKKVQPLPN